MPPHQAPGLVAMVLVAIAFLCLLQLDPFGIGTASEQRSEQAALRVTAPFYSSPGDVVVVLIDDEFLARSGKSWPLPYADQGRLLRNIFQGGPALVFLDLLYRQKHVGTANTSDAAASADDPMNLLAPIESLAATPLIFSAQIRADLRSSTLPALCGDEPPEDAITLQDEASLLPEFRRWAESRERQAPTALVGWWGCGDRYPLRLAAESGDQVTPALAMLEVYCQDARRQQAGCRALRALATRAGAAGVFTAPMVVRWGAFPPEQQRPFYAAGVCQQHADATGGVSAGLALKTAATQLVLGVFEDLRSAGRPELALPCPSVAVLPASLVRYGDQEVVRGLLRDKIVLLGARVSGIPDWHQSPVHGQVPGVILHAAAIDNLLVLGDRYARDMSSDAVAMVVVPVIASLAFFIPFLVILLDEPKRRLVSALGLLGWLGLAGFLSYAGASAAAVFSAVTVGIAIDLLMPIETLIYALVVIMSAVGAALMMGLGVAPANWIGMVLVALAFATVVKHYVRQEELLQFPHRMSFLGPAVKPWVEKLDRWPIRR